MRQLAIVVLAVSVAGCALFGARPRDWRLEDCTVPDPAKVKQDTYQCLADAPAGGFPRDRAYRYCMLGKGYKYAEHCAK